MKNKHTNKQENALGTQNPLQYLREVVACSPGKH